MDINNKLDELKNILKKAELFNHAISILNFDVETIAPKDALEDENETINYFSNEYFKMLNNDNVNSLIVYLHDKKFNAKHLLCIRIIFIRHQGVSHAGKIFISF